MSRPAVSRREMLGSVGLAAAGVGIGALDVAASAKTPTTPSRPPLPMTIAALQQLEAPYARRVNDISPQITLANGGSEAREAVGEADAVFGSLSPEQIISSPKLRWLHVNSAGVEHVLSPAVVEDDVIITNSRGCHGPQIAEHGFGLLLWLTRGLSNDGLAPPPREPVELRGKTMGIIGLGGIGREIARRAKAMDMTVIAVDAEPMFGERYRMADEIRLVDDGLDNLLERSDVVVIAAPRTARTLGMIGAAQFARMKAGAYLINVSRGSIVQTDCLVAALKEGRLAGAGLDVTDPEPLPADHALRAIPGVIVTPHTAGQSPLGRMRVQEVFVENVRRFANGLPLLNLVNKRAGY